jgi:two-component system, NtrC family, nitrogen regulation response regulator NtrX
MATVLIVDDDTDIRATVRMTLEDAGHAVREARDGEEAFALLRDDPQRLVALIDLRMPNVDGFALLKMVSEDWELARRHAYVIFSADTLSLPVVRALRSATVVASVAKPFEIDALLAAIDEAASSLAGSLDPAPPHEDDGREA